LPRITPLFAQKLMVAIQVPKDHRLKPVLSKMAAFFAEVFWKQTNLIQQQGVMIFGVRMHATNTLQTKPKIHSYRIIFNNKL